MNGEPVTTQTRITLQPGDVVSLELPGGGGYGPPAEDGNGAEAGVVPVGAGSEAPGDRPG